VVLERTFAFVDLAGFTALTEAHGDHATVDVVERFFESVGAAVGERGELVKTIGDAVMLAFPAPDVALLAARDLLERCAVVSEMPAPRAGLHHGPAVPRGDDWFGATVNLAARVAGQAFGGQTLATAPVATVARRVGVPVVDLGCFRLRNVTEPVELFQVELVPPPEAVSIDPVCRMQVAHAAAAGRLRHGDTDVWFCSLACVRAFAEDPART
jgi:class 3 adenylate cyclase